MAEDKTNRKPTRNDPAHPPWKRSLDIFLVFLFSPGLLIVSALVALVIKTGSRGPVLFKQRRVGYLGRDFTCYKFRTMQENASTQVHEEYTRGLIHSKKPMIKLDAAGDRRLIPFGALLRATGMDEVPQFLNVIRGEMSVVGPRPCVVSEYEQYRPWHRQRFQAVPGLTGLWQVNGKNKTTFDEMVRMDIHYARHRSFRMDLAIIARTLPALCEQVIESRARRRQTEEKPQTRIENPVTSV